MIPADALGKTSRDVDARTIGWPQSPMVLFTIATIFFAVMGMVFMSAGVLASRMPWPSNDRVISVPAGRLWLTVATPFALFALAYAILEIVFGRFFQRSPVRIQFVCAILAVLESIRVYVGWAASTSSVTPNSIGVKNLAGVISFSVLALAAFAWSLFTSRINTRRSRWRVND